MLIKNRILRSIGQLNVGSYTGVYAIPFVVHTSWYLVFLLQLVVSLVPTSAKYHSIVIQFEILVFTSPVMDLFIHNLSCVMICKGNLFY